MVQKQVARILCDKGATANSLNSVCSEIVMLLLFRMLNHRDFPAFNKDEGIELSLLCRLIQYIHHDYMKMVVSLLYVFIALLYAFVD